MKQYDICVVTGEYTDSQGQTKKRYMNVGAVIDKGDGPFIVLNRWFNPAGVPSKGGDSVLLSMFKPKEKEQTSAPSGYYDKARLVPPVQEKADFDDEIPF